MIYLILSIISSALVSITLRFSNKYKTNENVMYMSNYLACTLISLIFSITNNLKLEGNISFPILLGTISGIMYLVSLKLYNYNINKNGVIVSATFMKLGVLIPTIIAIVIYKESPTIFSILGFLLAIFSIIYMDKSDEKGNKNLLLLLILLLVGGITDSFGNFYDKEGSPNLKDLYLLILFFFAFLLSLILVIKNKEKINFSSVIFGLLIGIPNYFSSRFILLALAYIKAIIAYPTYNVGSVLITSIVGLLVFKEKIEKRKGISLILIIIAIVLLNM